MAAVVIPSQFPKERIPCAEVEEDEDGWGGERKQDWHLRSRTSSSRDAESAGKK